jgi:hypothetical protein
MVYLNSKKQPRIHVDMPNLISIIVYIIDDIIKGGGGGPVAIGCRGENTNFIRVQFCTQTRLLRMRG